MSTGIADAMQAIRLAAERAAAAELEAVHNLLTAKADGQRELAAHHLALHKTLADAQKPSQSDAHPPATSLTPFSTPYIPLPPELQSVYEHWQSQMNPAALAQSVQPLARTKSGGVSASPKRPVSAGAKASPRRVITSSGVRLESMADPPAPTVVRAKHPRPKSASAASKPKKQQPKANPKAAAKSTADKAEVAKARPASPGAASGSGSPQRWSAATNAATAAASAALEDLSRGPTVFGRHAPVRKAATDSSKPVSYGAIPPRSPSPHLNGHGSPLHSNLARLQNVPMPSASSRLSASGLTPWRQKKLDEKAKRDAEKAAKRQAAADAKHMEAAWQAAAAENAANALNAVAADVAQHLKEQAESERRAAEHAAELAAREQADAERRRARSDYLLRHQSEYGIFIADQPNQPPLLLYKMCAVWGNRYIDIFDGQTDYTLGASQHIPADDDVEAYHAEAFPCYVFATPELAIAEKFPSRNELDGDADDGHSEDRKTAFDPAGAGRGGSALLNTPRALLKVVVIGDARDYGNGKFTFAHIKAVEVVMWSSGSRLTSVRADDGTLIGRERVYQWVAAADAYRPPPLKPSAAKLHAGKRHTAPAPAMAVPSHELLLMLMQQPGLWRKFVSAHPLLFPRANKYDGAARVIPEPLAKLHRHMMAVAASSSAVRETAERENARNAKAGTAAASASVSASDSVGGSAGLSHAPASIANSPARARPFR